MTVGTVAGGVIGNRADAAFDKYVGGSLSHLAKSLSMPANHDLQKGLLSAHQRALAFTAETMSRQSRGMADRIVADRIVAMAKEPVAAHSSSFAQVELLTPLIAARPTASQAALLDEAAGMLVKWLERKSGELLPPHFRAVLTQPAPDGRAPWIAVLRVLIAKEIKTKPRFVNIFLSENVAEIAGRTVNIEAIVAEMERGLSGLRDELGLVAADVRRVLANQAEQERHNQQMLEFVAMAKASGIFEQAAAQGISELAVRRIVEELGGQGIEGDNLLTWLEGWIDAAREALSRHSNEGGSFEAARAEAARLFREGRGGAAAKPLMELLAQEQQESRRRQLAVIDEAITLAVLALDIDSLKLRLSQAARIAHPSAAHERATYLLQKATEFFDWGEQYDNNFAMLAAIETLRLLHEECTRDKVPLGLGEYQLLLGDALSVLGARERGTARLREAIRAYVAASKKYTRDHNPLGWARAQNNLGIALFRVGERESGTARLTEAILAFSAALEERTHGRVPLDWAATQCSLGAALQLLGEREGGTARLEQSVTAHQAALKERTRERVALEWAITQTNLGGSLRLLGEREGSAARLEQSVTAYRLALEELTPERAPLGWATAQNNLGAVLSILAEISGGVLQLEEAILAYQAALIERTRERVPLDWAMTQSNLGGALRMLGEREGSTARLEQAVVAHRLALQEYKRERVPLH